MQVFASPIEAPDFMDHMTTQGGYDFDAYQAAGVEYEQKVQEWAREQGTHPLAGEVIRTPMADGYASYVLAKVNNRLSLIHLAYGDAWHDDRFCRLMTVKEAKLMVAQAARMRALFA